jgi:hypothetical protein
LKGQILPYKTAIIWKDEISNLQQMAFEGKSYQDIGDIYGVTRERIRQIFHRYGLQHSQNIKRKERQVRRYKKFGDETQELYRVKKHKFASKKANSRRTGIKFTIDFGDLVWPSYCPVLGIPINYLSPGISENSPSIDQIVPGKGYVPGNVAVMSWRANRIKNDGTLEEHEKIVTWLKNMLTDTK